MTCCNVILIIRRIGGGKGVIRTMLCEPENLSGKLKSHTIIVFIVCHGNKNFNNFIFRGHSG